MRNSCAARPCARVRVTSRTRRRLRRLHVLAQPARGIESCGRQRVRPGRLGSRRHQDDLLDASTDEFLEQRARARRTVAQTMRFAPPVAVGGERTSWCSVASGTVSAAATASARWSRATPARSSTSARRASASRVDGRLRSSRRRDSATSANTRSRPASTSWTTISSSRKPAGRGFRRAARCSAARDRCATAASAAPPPARGPTARPMQCVIAGSAVSGAGTTRHHHGPRA